MPTSRGSEWLRIGVMGFCLAALVFLVFVYQPQGSASPGVPAVETPDYDATPVPEIDEALLAEVRDATRTERLVMTDTAPLRHLLEKSLRVTPSVARKLGLPAEPVPIERLRNDPDEFRGRYLWYKGQLESLSKPKPGHPVPGYDWYEGLLRTADGEPVKFAFSVPPPADLEVGDWVRMEGFFLKLRDAHLPVPLDRAPMLVGPELTQAYPDWNAVEELDPAVLARVEDGVWVERPGPDLPGAANGDFENAPDIERMLADSQDVPLWHLASYAMHRAEDPSVRWSEVPAFVSKAQLDAVRHGEMEKGTPMRILGTLVKGRVMPAKANPLGIESWTEVWIQVHDLGGKLIPVWIPQAVDAGLGKNQAVVAKGYLFKRYRYARAMDGLKVWTPLFVAADLERFELSGEAMANPITFGFAGLVLLVIGLFFVMARRDRRERQRHEAELVERRRRRRSVPATAGEMS